MPIVSAYLFGDAHSTGSRSKEIIFSTLQLESHLTQVSLFIIAVVINKFLL